MDKLTRCISLWGSEPVEQSQLPPPPSCPVEVAICPVCPVCPACPAYPAYPTSLIVLQGVILAVLVVLVVLVASWRHVDLRTQHALRAYVDQDRAFSESTWGPPHLFPDTKASPTAHAPPTPPKRS